MKIVGSKTHDFYDSCRALGHDETGNLYLREPKHDYIQVRSERGYRSRVEKVHNEHLSFLVKGLPTQRYEWHNEERTTFTLSFLRILFAGKLYGGVRLETLKAGCPVPPTHTRYFYNFDELNEHLNNNGVAINNTQRRYSLFHDERRTTEQIIREGFFSTDKFLQECVANKLVIAKVEYQKNSMNVEFNGSLAPYEFYRVMDPFTAYQELAMYVDGALCYPGNMMIEIADRYKIAAHGFDNRSFRKDPTKNVRK